MHTAIRSIPLEYRTPAEHAGSVETLSIPGHSDALVYLPCGYGGGERRYPVFYLLHGGGGEPRCFFTEDRILQYELDHMIENGEIAPLIVVAPTYYEPGWRDKGIGASAEAVSKFAPILRGAIVPAVDQKYRTVPRRESRAIGGFSMGGVATWQAFLETPDLFYWYMPLSGDCWAYGELGGSRHDKETAALLADTARGKDFYIHALTGDKDIAYPNLTAQIEAMRAYPDEFAFGKNIFYSVLPDGYHDYPYMHRYIYHALPGLFF